MNEFKSVEEYLKDYKKEESKKKERKEKKIFTFIESGKFKGKKLLLPSLSTTRSTKSIVKTCVFNVIRNELYDKTFIEVFGGSALMAAEALSNYAKKAYAIEKDKKAYIIALKNAKNIDENLNVLNADSFEILKNLVDNNDDLILYFDPPFDIRDGYDDIYEKVYKLINSLNQDKIHKIIIEHNSKIQTEQKLRAFEKIKIKKFGSTTLSFYDKKL